MCVDKVRLPFTESHSDQFDGMYTNQSVCKVRIKEQNLCKAFYSKMTKILKNKIFQMGEMELLVTQLTTTIQFNFIKYKLGRNNFDLTENIRKYVASIVLELLDNTINKRK